MNTLLAKRIGLAVSSGIGVGVIQIYDGFFDDLGGELTFYVLSGMTFAAGVLLPYLKRDDHFLVRILALVIASAASYYSAVWLALEGPFADDNGWISFTIASVAGATIVMAALVLTTLARASREFIWFGMAAGLIGGPITFSTLTGENFTILIGHASWHALVCVAIYFGTRNGVQPR
jgi:hypothetical protein